MADGAAVAALATFLAGVVFYSGRLSSRVDALEQWRREMLPEFRALHQEIAQLVQLVTTKDA